MNIEELSKAQLILLTILVNFVTSVATGILTVSLLDHAPPLVTQTVNRVIEHTIETVTAAAPTPAVQTPAPSNQELVTTAISTVAGRMVALYAADTGTSTPAFAIGTYLSKSRSVVTSVQEWFPKEVLVEFPNGTLLAASLARQSGQLAIYGFGDSAVLPKIASPALLASTELKLGQTVLAITSSGSAATGIVSRISQKGIVTTLPDIGIGSTAVDLSGNLIGIATGLGSGLLTSAGSISQLLAATSTTATSTAASK